ADGVGVLLPDDGALGAPERPAGSAHGALRGRAGGGLPRSFSCTNRSGRLESSRGGRFARGRSGKPPARPDRFVPADPPGGAAFGGQVLRRSPAEGSVDRKSTRLNSSHVKISYSVFC